MLTDRQHDTFHAAVLYEDDSFREPLKGAVAVAGGVVSTELRLSSFADVDQIEESILIVNLEPLLLRREDLLDQVLSFRGRLIFNDGEASERLVGSARARWARHLAAKINQSQGIYPPMPDPQLAEDGLDSPPLVSSDPADIEMWVLAASIGGPEAMRSFLGELTADLPFCIVLAQHIGPEFMHLMCEQLDKTSRLPVRVAIDGEAFKPGRVYVVPPNRAFRVTRENRIRLTDLIERSSYSPNIDQVLRDAVERFGASAHAIIFSGMASDAIAGAALVMERGGEVWVQDPQTCVVSSMVDGALKFGEVEFMADPKHLAHRLNQRGIEQH